MRHLVWPSAAMATLLTVAGCTLGSSDRVEEVDPEQLGGLNEPTTTSTTTTTTVAFPDTAVDSTVEAPPGNGPTSVGPNGATTVPATITTVDTEDVTVYFVDGSMLVELEMPVEADARLRRRLRLLEEGPQRDARDAGVRTAVLAGLVSGVQIGDDAVTVDLDGEVFANVDRSDQRLAFGQIVLTITADSEYRAVTFTLDDEPIGVFRRDGTRGEPGELVTVEDYTGLLDDS